MSITITAIFCLLGLAVLVGGVLHDMGRKGKGDKVDKMRKDGLI
jgi:hypothetical protein